MAYKPARNRVIEWPFKTVLPDGSVPPPTKIERINTFLENQMIQDGRTRKSTHGMSKESSFLRHTVIRKPTLTTSFKVKVNEASRPENVKKDEIYKDKKRYVVKDGKKTETKKKPSLPSINSKTMKKPLLMASSRCTVVPKQQTRISPDIYHCYLKQGQAGVVPEQDKRSSTKVKAYTGISRKQHNKKFEKLSRNKEGSFQIDVSKSGPKPSPQDCLRSFRQVRDGHKRYDTFWTPAKSLTSHKPTTDRDSLTSRKTDEDSLTSQSIEGDLSIYGVGTGLVESPTGNKEPLSSRSSVASKSEKSPKKSSKNSTKRVSFLPPETQVTPKLDLSRIHHQFSDGDSDYNEQDLGKLDIMSSGSENESNSGDPSRIVTESELEFSIQESVSLNKEDISDELKQAIEDYVAQIITQSQEIYLKCVQQSGQTEY